jgi:putative addiction module killer protein
MRVVEYVTAKGESPFAEWFDALDPIAAAKIGVAVTRLAAGYSSNVKVVGGGVSEYKVDFGPGYRIYFARDGEILIVLLGGGTKRRQHSDIERSIVRWNDYKSRKKGK